MVRKVAVKHQSSSSLYLLNILYFIVNKEKSIDQLKLALAWNRIDIAKNEIFTSGVKWEVSDKNPT